MQLGAKIPSSSRDRKSKQLKHVLVSLYITVVHAGCKSGFTGMEQLNAMEQFYQALLGDYRCINNNGGRTF